MKNLLKYSLVWTLSLLFVSVSLGHDFVEYCCSRCEAEGIEAVLSADCHEGNAAKTAASSCCGEHEKEQPTQSKKGCCGENTCQIKHWKIDDFSFSTAKNLQLKAPVNDLNFTFAVLTLFSFEPIETTVSNAFSPSQNPLLTCGRAILTSKCVLVI